MKDIWVGWRFGGTFGARGVSKNRAMVGLKIVLAGRGKMVILKNNWRVNPNGTVKVVWTIISAL